MELLAAAAELKRAAAAEVKVKRAAAAAAEEDADEQAYFDRIETFGGRNMEFVQTAARAVGKDNGASPVAGGPTPDGGWEAKVVRMLKQGFYPNGLVEFQEDQYSPLHLAVVHNHKSMCQILLAAGADANLSCNFGDVCYPPLHDVQSEDVCALLLDVADPSIKADVNALAMGCTALMMAAARGDEGIVFMLLAAGADPTIYATYSAPRVFKPEGEGSLAGETAAKTARRCGHLTLAGMLDDAERSHPKPWVEPASEEGPGPGDPGYTEYAVEQIRENRASLERRMKEGVLLPTDLIN